MENDISYRNEEGEVDAHWRCDIDFGDPGFGTYLNDVIENYWKSLKYTFMHNLANQDVGKVFGQLVTLVHENIEKYDHINGVRFRTPNLNLLTG